MNDVQEAMARIAIADIEARQLKEKIERRSRRGRLATAIASVAALFALSIYVQVSPWQISAKQACGWFLFYLAGIAWMNYHTGERLRSLRSEIDRLKDQINERSA